MEVADRHKGKIMKSGTASTVAGRFSLRMLLTVILVLIYVPQGHSQQTASADEDVILELTKQEDDEFNFQPLRTDSPRETLNSFIRLTWLLESALLKQPTLVQMSCKHAPCNKAVRELLWRRRRPRRLAIGKCLLFPIHLQTVFTLLRKWISIAKMNVCGILHSACGK